MNNHLSICTSHALLIIMCFFMTGCNNSKSIKKEQNVTVFHGNVIYTSTPDTFQVLEHGYIVVDQDGIIQSVGTTLPEEYQSATVEELGDKLLIPAMNDLHVHAPQFRNQAIAMDKELLSWLEAFTFPEEKRFSDVRYAQQVYKHFIHTLWLNGTMRASTFATIHKESTLLLADMFDQSGMGAKIGLVAMNRNCPDFLQNTTEEYLSDFDELIRHTEKMSLVDPIVTPRFVPTCTPEMLSALGNLAVDNQLPVQSHLSENKGEIQWVKELDPSSSCYGDNYKKYKLFGQTPTLMAHCCYSEGVEEQMIADCGVMVVHCPTSNSNLSSGCAPIRRFLEKGIKVSLGTDISGGHQASIFHVMQHAIQISKLRYAQSNGKEPFLKLSEAFHMATKVGGSFFGKVGSFEPGYEFDALVIDDSSLNELSASANYIVSPYTLLQRLERLVYIGDDRQIERRFCKGKEIADPLLTLADSVK